MENDAVQFEILKKDGRSVNKNRFLSMLILGYYDSYIEEADGVYHSICSILGKYSLDEERQSVIANEIVKDVFLPEVPAREGKKPVTLSLKPTKETEPVIERIRKKIGVEDYTSQFLCRMLMSYCEKPFSRREQILFKGNYDYIVKACEKHDSISFTTIWNVADIHEVIPYRVVAGKEEMFTYVLCAEKNKQTGNIEARSYRLNRIGALWHGHLREPIPENVVKYLEMMIQYAPQFAINDDEISCVRLTEEGCKYFNRIYYGRPKVDDQVKNGDCWLYYFKCSEEQLYQYFKRFERNWGEVVEPETLRQRIQKFHEEAMKI